MHLYLKPLMVLLNQLGIIDITHLTSQVIYTSTKAVRKLLENNQIRLKTQPLR